MGFGDLAWQCFCSVSLGEGKGEEDDSDLGHAAGEVAGAGRTRKCATTRGGAGGAAAARTVRPIIFVGTRIVIVSSTKGSVLSSSEGRLTRRVLVARSMAPDTPDLPCV